MNSFVLNGKYWEIVFVAPTSPLLIDRTGNRRVATTDPYTSKIYLSSALKGDFLNRVLVHELGHATMMSFDLLDDIHSVVDPEHWIEAEEWVCNFIADYGRKIFNVAYEVLGDDAWLFVPYRLNRLAG